jgi:hypothetical protein
VTGLLPHAVRDAIAARGDDGASTSFALVTFAVLVVILLEHEALRVALAARSWITSLFVAATSLSVAVVLTMAVRIAHLLP